MKSLITIMTATFCTLVSSGHTEASARDGSHSRVEIRTQQTNPTQAGLFELRFELIDTTSRQPIADADLRITHERKLHMFVFDPSLREYHHIHPEFVAPNWKIELNLPTNGNYWIWVQGEHAAEQFEFTSATRLEIRNGAPAWPMPPVLGDIRRGASENSVVELSARRLVAGRSAMLAVTFSRNDGTVPSITPYLGAFAHMVVVPTGGNELIHVHPMDGPSPNEGILHTTFAEPGEYRVWIQFLDDGQLRVIPLSVTVYKQ